MRHDSREPDRLIRYTVTVDTINKTVVQSAAVTTTRIRLVTTLEARGWVHGNPLIDEGPRSKMSDIRCYWGNYLYSQIPTNFSDYKYTIAGIIVSF